MARAKISDHEWQMLLSLADRLQIPVRQRQEEAVRFSAIEAAGHELGRAVARIATERLASAQAERMSGSQPCPSCSLLCPLDHRDREVETVDGTVGLSEPVCHCSACRRDFFPSASAVGP
jgi:hypothetical protein